MPHPANVAGHLPKPQGCQGSFWTDFVIGQTRPRRSWPSRFTTIKRIQMTRCATTKSSEAEHILLIWPHGSERPCCPHTGQDARRALRNAWTRRRLTGTGYVGRMGEHHPQAAAGCRGDVTRASKASSTSTRSPRSPQDENPPITRDVERRGSAAGVLKISEALWLTSAARRTPSTRTQEFTATSIHDQSCHLRAPCVPWSAWWAGRGTEGAGLRPSTGRGRCGNSRSHLRHELLRELSRIGFIKYGLTEFVGASGHEAFRRM